MTPPGQTRPWPMVLRLAAVWLLFAAGANCAGWGLSLLGELNAKGCLLAGIPIVAIVAISWRLTGGSGTPRRPSLAASRISRRMLRDHSFAAWLVIALLALAGGLLNPPSNYDAITYRLPRLLYWLQDERWHWIGAINFRMDIAGAGFEWMSLPFLAFGSCERALFLLNFIPFLLLPGLFFIAASGLGLGPRHAKWWMWIWPLSYGIILQAASIGNDMIGAAFALASLAFTARARKNNPVPCLMFSALAAALMTSIKVTMLPLGLPLAVAWVWVAIKRMGPLRAAAWGFVAGILLIPSSFVPIAMLCAKHTGKWSGNPNNQLKIEVTNPLAGLIVNGSELALGALALPVLPARHVVEERIAGMVDHSNLIRWAGSHYPGYHSPKLGEIPMEESSGIGMGVTVLGMIWMGAAVFRKPPGHASRDALATAVALASLVAALAFLAKAAGNSSPRLMLPFVPLLILALMTFFKPKNLPSPRSRLVVLPALLILPAIIINPNRPLITADFLGSLPIIPSSIRTRLIDVSAAYAGRGNILSPLAQRVPNGQTIGFAGEMDHSPLALFRPFRSRRVIEITPESIQQVDWIVATPRGIKNRLGCSAEEWMRRDGFELKSELPLVSKASVGAENWQIYRRRNQQGRNSLAQ